MRAVEPGHPQRVSKKNIRAARKFKSSAFPLNAPYAGATNKWVRQEGKMLTLTVLKSVILVAGLVAASMFLQAAMSFGKLPLVLGQ